METLNSARPVTSFYYNIYGTEAERLLNTFGSDGEFLARPSNSNPLDYTLSIRRGNRITHVKIQNTGDFLDFYGGETFATLSELVQYYVDNPNNLKERDGSIINLKRPLVIPSTEPIGWAACQSSLTERWYHTNLSGREAERMLMSQGKHGTYLVRESQSTPGKYAISVRNEDAVIHIMIDNKGGRFDLGGGDSFNSLGEMLEHYTRNPLVETGGRVVRLISPLPSTRCLASCIDERVAILEQVDKVTGKDGFAEEFEKVQTEEVAQAQFYALREGKMSHNVAKNRYKNILPYDHTRIRLMDGVPESNSTATNTISMAEQRITNDYINANLIMVMPSYPEFAGLQRAYISTQGCLSSTVDDFWRMIWQERTRIMVMTTKEMERGRTKCVRYWPDLHEEAKYGLHKELTVKNVEEHVAPDYIVRTFRLSRNSESESSGKSEPPRTVYHWHFLGWPDHGCPVDPGTVLNFLEQVNVCLDRQCPKDDTGPIVVHCSAGIGRTGTFIVIDLILIQIKRIGLNYQVDIPRAVRMVREQRSGMVQTEQQYRFIYQAIASHVETIRKHLDCARQISNSSGREYTNIRYSAEQAAGGNDQLTPTSPLSSPFSTLNTSSGGDSGASTSPAHPAMVKQLQHQGGNLQSPRSRMPGNTQNRSREQPHAVVADPPLKLAPPPLVRRHGKQ